MSEKAEHAPGCLGDRGKVSRTCPACNPVKWAWWSINGEALMQMLQRVKNGEEPFLVYAEAYANSEVYEKPEGD